MITTSTMMSTPLRTLGSLFLKNRSHRDDHKTKSKPKPKAQQQQQQQVLHAPPTTGSSSPPPTPIPSATTPTHTVEDSLNGATTERTVASSSASLSSSPSSSSAPTSIAPPSSTTHLRRLAHLVLETTESIEHAYEAKGLHAPALDEIDGPDLLPEVEATTRTLVAACGQLIATTMPTGRFVWQRSIDWTTGACLRLAIDSHVAETLRSGPKHVEEIAKHSNVDSTKLSRCLRVLCTRHIFQETEPDVFANNRASLVLDKGKDVETLVDEGREFWYDNSDGVAALIGHCTDESFKAGSYLPETLLSPTLASATASNKAPIQVAYGEAAYTANPIPYPGSWFDMLNQPGNEPMHARFMRAMAGNGRITRADPDALPLGVDWANLPAGSVVCDVGGGVGSQSMLIARKNPHLKFVVQDLGKVVKSPGTRMQWEKKLPGAIDSHQVILQEHNFFEPQSVVGAAVYMARHVIHDWPKTEAVRILRHLADAARPNPDSRIVVISHIVPHACPSGHAGDEKLPPALRNLTRPAPEPLLTNFGEAGLQSLNMDMIMLVELNASERTPKEWADLLDESGLELEKVEGDIDRGDLMSIVCKARPT